MKCLQIFVVSLLFLTATCNKGTSSQNQDLMKVTGQIEKTGITSYQYGTHTLEGDETFYALKSDKIDLSPYEGKSVTVTAEKIEGYPVDGGPEYLNVVQVKE